jgi:hypothetical protein
MSLDKAIKSGKEKRKQYPYGDWRNVDITCRCHGSDWHFLNNRMYQRRKALQKAEYQEE